LHAPNSSTFTCPTSHCVLTATLVEPRVTPFPSVRRTKMRDVPGANGIAPLAVAKIANVGVAFAAIVTVALGPGVIGLMHTLVVGLVWQIESATGKVAELESAVAVMEAAAPKFTVATAKAPEPALPAISTMPGSPLAAKATMSGTGVADAESSRVLRPAELEAAGRLAQSKPSTTFTGRNAAWGVNAKTKLFAAPAATETGVFGEPVSALVVGSVDW
jgi:hypothetical protein